MGKIDDPIRAVLQSHKDELHDRFHVESLSIFGSVSRGTARPDSDIDILVRYRNAPGIFEFLRLKQYLEGIMGRPVDLVTEGALKKQLKNGIIQEAIRVT
jgi:predicted nucleotidyltransferase